MDDRHQGHLIAELNMAPTAAVPESGREFGAQAREHCGLRAAQPAGVRDLALPVTEVRAIEEGRMSLPGLDHFGRETWIEGGEPKTPQAFFLELEHGHLDLLRRHGRHVACLLVHATLRRDLPLSQREGGQYGQDSRGQQHGCEDKNVPRLHGSADSRPLPRIGAGVPIASCPSSCRLSCPSFCPCPSCPCPSCHPFCRPSYPSSCLCPSCRRCSAPAHRRPSRPPPPAPGQTRESSTAA